jgi:HAE1 family hydrophobic/amphiphilic exporter-1
MVELRKERRAKKKAAKREKKSGIPARTTSDSDEPEPAGV